MLFQHTWKKVLDGSKTQTRRLVKPGHQFWGYEWGGHYQRVLTKGGRIKWEVGHTYAVQPGRGQKAVGRIRITAIRREPLTEITEEDARAEGMMSDYWDSLPSYKARVDPRHILCSAFADLWDTVHRKGPYFEDDPDVWILEFELVKEAEPA